MFPPSLPMKKRAEKPTRVVRRSLDRLYSGAAYTGVGCWRCYMADAYTPAPPDPRTQRSLTASEEMERRARYDELCMLAAQAMRVACKDPIAYDEYTKCMRNIISRKQRYNNGEDGHKNSINQDAKTCEGTAASVVADPIQVSTEGALSETQKVHSGRTPRGRLLCGLCREPVHNIRKCKHYPKNQ